MTTDELRQLGKLFDEKLAPIKSAIADLKKGQETLELKVEAVHEFNKKAHAETMETLLEISEINYRELKKELAALKKRIEQLEARQQN